VLLDNFIQHRNEEAFADLVARHGPMVYGVCQRVLRNTHAAEDVAQSTFQLLATSANGIRRPEALAAWLHQTARHLALKHLRKETRRLRRESQLARRARANHARDPLDALTVRELLEVFDAELGCLHDQHRLPLILCVLEGLSQKQAAERLGWTLQQIKGGLERGRAQLRKALVRQGLTGAAVAVSLEAMHEFVRAQPLPTSLTSAITRAATYAVVDSTCSSSALVKAFGGVGQLKALSLAGLVTALLLAGAGAIYWPAGGRPAEAETSALPPDNLPGIQNVQRVDLQGDPLPEGALARLGTVRWRGRGEISALALSPDGKLAAVAGEGGLSLIEVASGKPLRNLADLRINPYMLAFSPDGTRLALCGRSFELNAQGAKTEVWEIRNAQLLHAFDTHLMRQFGWTKDGQLQGVFANNGAIVVRDLASGKEIALEDAGPKSTPGRRNFFAFSSESRVLAFYDAREKQPEIHIYDATTGKKRSVLQGPKGQILANALTSNGEALASLTGDADPAGDTVHIWDVAAARISHTIRSDQKSLSNVAFSPDGKVLVTVAWQNVRCWDVATGRELSRTQGVNSFAKQIAFTPDGKKLISVENHRPGLHVWDAATGMLQSEPVGHLSVPACLAFSPDGRRVVTGGTDGKVIVWDVNTGASHTGLQQRSWAQASRFSDGGLSLYAVGIDDKIRIVDALNGQERHVLEIVDPERPDTRQSGIILDLLDDQRTLVAFSKYESLKPDGQEARETLITGWDALTQQLLFRRRREAIDLGTAVSPDGKILAVGQFARDPMGAAEDERGVEGGGPILLEDLRTGEQLFSLPPHEGQEEPDGFSSDGRILVTTKHQTETTTFRLWETTTGNLIRTIPTVMNGRFSFSLDGRLLAMNPSLQEISLWDLQLGKEVRRIRGFDADVAGLDFSPDGRRLISTLSDSTLLVWDVGSQNRPASRKELNAVQIAAAWKDLAGADAASAFRVRKLLAGSPANVVSFLKAKLEPAVPPNAARVKKLIADLGSDRLADREHAQKELSALGEVAGQALQDALGRKPPLELRRRIEMLQSEARGPVRPGEKLRALRALAVLEDIANPEARSILESISQGEPRARLTREAKGSLTRIAKLERARKDKAP
jgi:RNA polymerase sigma factor (sigma-70 family)